MFYAAPFLVFHGLILLFHCFIDKHTVFAILRGGQLEPRADNFTSNEGIRTSDPVWNATAMIAWSGPCQSGWHHHSCNVNSTINEKLAIQTPSLGIKKRLTKLRSWLCNRWTNNATGFIVSALIKSPRCVSSSRICFLFHLGSRCFYSCCSLYSCNIFQDPSELICTSDLVRCLLQWKTEWGATTRTNIG